MIDCVWYNRQRGSWDHGLLQEIFRKNPQHFLEWNLERNPILPRAIVIVVGKPDVKELREYLSKMTSGIVILTSEEDAYFDWKAAIPKHLEVWTQYYSSSTKSEIKERLLLGAPNRLKNYKINKHLPKKYLWSFVGQVQNPFRQQCVDVLKTLPDGYLQICSMFGGEGENGMEYQEYLDIMCQSHYVICPAGSMCVDSFRLYEAIECGAIPITDVRAPRDPEGFDYWKEVFPEMDVLYKATPNWKEALELMPHMTLDADFFEYWWNEYKQELEEKLIRYAQ